MRTPKLGPQQTEIGPHAILMFAVGWWLAISVAGALFDLLVK
jgi:hypothetical protein